MKNSQTHKPPVTVSIHRLRFWLLCFFVSITLLALSYIMYGIILPKNLQNDAAKYKSEYFTLLKENSLLKSKNDDLLIQNGVIQQNLESELVKIAELQAQANIVEKIKHDSLEEIEKYSSKVIKQKEQLAFYQELMSPSVEQELQCFNMDVNYGNKYVDYGINLLLDDKEKTANAYSVEFRLLTGKNNVELTETMPETLAPDLIRKINIKHSIRLTGKIKHNNKLGALKVLDVRVLNKNNKLAAQCWKVF